VNKAGIPTHQHEMNQTSKLQLYFQTFLSVKDYLWIQA